MTTPNGLYRDAWGIPHLRAGDPYELAFAQGRVTAIDRAWQIEVERRRATGTSAAILGPDAVAWDRFARQARLADTAERCLRALDALDDDTARWVRAYVDGVNAGLAAGVRRAPEFTASREGTAAGTRRNPESAREETAAGTRQAQECAREETAAGTRRNPESAREEMPAGARRAPEFAASREGTAAGLTPGRWEPWTPLAIWLSHHILFAHFPAKLWRAAVAERLGPEAVAVFAADGPGSGGSNGWLVPADRTTTGAALIAGDPHRFIEDPGFYQQIRLACPEFDVIGLAVPGVPGIAHFGHAGSVAWAITNAMADYQDLYRERLRRRDGGVEALGPDGWRPCAAHVETIEVAGEAPVEVEVVETERGPVVMHAGPGPEVGEGGPATAEGPDHARGFPRGFPGGVWEAVSLRYPPRVRHDLGFAALPSLLRAKTVADVDRALDHWAEPVNVVLAADTSGGLLHRVAGVVPVRHPDNGLRAVPAWEPGHEWSGDYAPLPRREISGITVMANERGIAAPLGVEFAPRHRADRIRRLLDGSPRWSAADMASVHTDTLLPSAGPLLDLLRGQAGLDGLAGLGGLSPEAVRLRDRLAAWDRRMDAASIDAAAYAEVRAEVVRRLTAHPALACLAGLDAEAPEVFRPWLALTPRVAYALESLLTTDVLPGLDRAALAELARAALEEVAARDELAGVRWGDLHRLAPWRALQSSVDNPGSVDNACAGSVEGASPVDTSRVDDPASVDNACAGSVEGASPVDTGRVDDPASVDDACAGSVEGAGSVDTGRVESQGSVDDAVPGEAGVPGDHDCVLSTSSVPGVTHHFARGPAARYVWDLARRDGSLWIVPFGASGVPGDPHWRDQHPLWLRGELAPVITDWDLLIEERHDD